MYDVRRMVVVLQPFSEYFEKTTANSSISRSFLL